MELDQIENIFLDLDGTTLRSDKTISKNTLIALDKLKEKNINVFIATGRHHLMIKEEMSIFDVHDEAICINGGSIYNFKENELIYSNPIDSDESELIAKYIIDNDLPSFVYTDDIMYYNLKKRNYWYKFMESKLSNLADEFKWEFLPILKNKFDFRTKIIKFFIAENQLSKEEHKKLYKFLSTLKKVIWINSQEGVLDIISNTSSKGMGIRKIIEKYNLDPNKTLAFGDALNDISMFKEVKFSVAMTNGFDETKQLATFCAKTNDEDGVYHFLVENKII